MSKTDRIIRKLQDAATAGTTCTLTPDEAEELAREHIRATRLAEEEHQVREQTEAILAERDSKLTEISHQLAQLIRENERLINEAQRRGQVLLQLGVRTI